MENIVQSYYTVKKMDLPPAIRHGEVPQACIAIVAQSYQIPPELIGGILFVEAGRVGMAMTNKNGSKDYGPAQVNSAWLERTKEVGVDAVALQHDPCKNLWAAGWILRRCLNKFPDSFWLGVGCYHSGENPTRDDQKQRQRAYAVKVFNAVSKTRGAFLKWLNG